MNLNELALVICDVLLIGVTAVGIALHTMAGRRRRHQDHDVH